MKPHDTDPDYLKSQSQRNRRTRLERTSPPTQNFLGKKADQFSLDNQG